MEAHAPGENRRGSWQGAFEVVRYNLIFYAAGLITFLAGLVFVVMPIPFALRVAGALASLVAAGWSLASIAASHAVYDVSRLWDFRWLGTHVQAPRNWLVVHAGLDEASHALHDVFPVPGTSVDIYDAKTMTERAIEVARRTPQSPQALQGTRDALPLPDGSMDLVVMYFMAHEVRDRPGRIALLREAGRLLSAQGRIAIAEQGRDVANFLAFGPGFLHFFSVNEWRRCIAAAGLSIVARPASDAVCARLRAEPLTRGVASPFSARPHCRTRAR